MKSVTMALAMTALGAVPALAADYHIKVTNMMPEGQTIAPLIVLDATAAEPFLFSDGYLSEDFVTTVIEGDPRPMNGKIGAGVAGPVLGKSGPPGVLIDGGEVAETDLFIESSTIRFYAKGSAATGEDLVISGVHDMAMGGGTIMLNRYDIGHTEGTKEVTLVDEGVVKVEITRN